MKPTAQAWPLFLLVGLFAPAGVIAPKSVAPLLFITAVWLLWHRFRDNTLKRPFRGSLTIVLAVIIGWSAISAVWALDLGAALSTSGKLAAVLASALILLDAVKHLPRQQLTGLVPVLVGAFAVAALLLAAESLSGAAGHKWLVWQGNRAEYDLTVLNRSEAVLLLATWPVALLLWQRFHWAWAVLALVASTAIVFAGVSNSNQVAVLIALIGTAAALLSGPWFQRFMALVLAVGFLVGPMLPTSILSPQRLSGLFDENQYSGLHRLYIWNFAAQRISDAPVLGWGMDAARRIPGGDTKLPGGGNVMSMHPHNATLQVWLELGGIGALLLAFLVSGLWLAVAAKERRADRAAATGLLLSGLIIANLSFGVWQTWWMAALAQAGSLCVLTFRIMEKVNE